MNKKFLFAGWIMAFLQVKTLVLAVRQSPLAREPMTESSPGHQWGKYF